MSVRRPGLADELYFITIAVVSWQPVFIRREYSEHVMTCLRHCRDRKGLEIYAYVLMPNHLHAVVRSGGRPLAATMRDVKSYSAKTLIQLIADNPQESRREPLARLFAGYGEHNAMNRDDQFWQNGYHPIELHTPAVTRPKIAYIHQNPVRVGFVSEPAHWFYSSAHPQNPLGVFPEGY